MEPPGSRLTVLSCFYYNLLSVELKRLKYDDDLLEDTDPLCLDHNQFELDQTTSLPAPSKLKSPSKVELLLSIEQKQCHSLLDIDYSSSKVTHIYNPLDYASETHSHFVRQYGNGPKKVMFLGMNPGPFGMAQNGVS